MEIIYISCNIPQQYQSAEDIHKCFELKQRWEFCKLSSSIFWWSLWVLSSSGCSMILWYSIMKKLKEGKCLFKWFISICILSSNLYFYFCGKWVMLLTLWTCGFILKMVPKAAGFEISDAYTVSHHSSRDIFLIEKIIWSCSIPFLPTPAAHFCSLTALSIVLATITCGLPWFILFSQLLYSLMGNFQPTAFS